MMIKLTSKPTPTVDLYVAVKQIAVIQQMGGHTYVELAYRDEDEARGLSVLETPGEIMMLMMAAEARNTE